MKQKVIAEVSVIPIGTPTPGLSHYIAACIDILKDTQDIRWEVTPMGTIMEGSLERVLEFAQKMHQAPFEMGVQRVLTTIKIDERRDKPQTMEDKVRAALIVPQI